ncbi:regulator of chromosome condensation [Anaeramoeba flamelloides]|uniref:Regulator of chromosome condensation n=1 Tax=Anaeramoeba flamelloides TaxID=1746091 RepID=A0AAV8A5P0_9EUKA|nr:regulator of chromosome condensation [Anaeramoeba flamelloides]
MSIFSFQVLQNDNKQNSLDDLVIISKIQKSKVFDETIEWAYFDQDKLQNTVGLSTKGKLYFIKSQNVKITKKKGGEKKKDRKMEQQLKLEKVKGIKKEKDTIREIKKEMEEEEKEKRKKIKKEIQMNQQLKLEEQEQEQEQEQQEEQQQQEEREIGVFEKETQKIAKKERFCQICCGNYHFLALSQNQKNVYSWCSDSLGSRNGQLGHGTAQQIFQPTLIEFFSAFKTPVKQILCSAYSSFVLLEDGSVYAFGYNTSYDLGYSKSSASQFLPLKVFDNCSILFNSGNSCHTFGLDKEGALFGFGLNSKGQLGTRNYSNVKTPTGIPLLNKDQSHSKAQVKIKQICTTFNSTLILTSFGKLFSAGHYFENGFNKNSNVFQLIKLPEIMNISCGLRSHFCFSIEGLIYAFGFLSTGSPISTKGNVIINTNLSVPKNQPYKVCCTDPLLTCSFLLEKKIINREEIFNKIENEKINLLSHYSSATLSSANLKNQIVIPKKVLKLSQKLFVINEKTLFKTPEKPHFIAQKEQSIGLLPLTLNQNQELKINYSLFLPLKNIPITLSKAGIMNIFGCFFDLQKYIYLIFLNKNNLIEIIRFHYQSMKFDQNYNKLPLQKQKLLANCQINNLLTSIKFFLIARQNRFLMHTSTSNIFWIDIDKKEIITIKNRLSFPIYKNLICKISNNNNDDNDNSLNNTDNQYNISINNNGKENNNHLNSDNELDEIWIIREDKGIYSLDLFENFKLIKYKFSKYEPIFEQLKNSVCFSYQSIFYLIIGNKELWSLNLKTLTWNYKPCLFQNNFSSYVILDGKLFYTTNSKKIYSLNLLSAKPEMTELSLKKLKAKLIAGQTQNFILKTKSSNGLSYVGKSQLDIKVSVLINEKIKLSQEQILKNLIIIDDDLSDQIIFQFKTEIAGKYQMDIFLNNFLLTNKEPIKFTVYSGNPDISKIFIENYPNLKQYAFIDTWKLNTEVSLNLTICDHYSNIIINNKLLQRCVPLISLSYIGKHQKSTEKQNFHFFNSEIDNNSVNNITTINENENEEFDLISNSSFNITPKYIKNGKFQLKFQLKNIGVYRCTILIGGIPLVFSPFLISCKKSISNNSNYGKNAFPPIQI